MLANFLNKRVSIFCGVYIYEGILVELTDYWLKLEDVGIVYETGPFHSETWENRQALPSPWYISVESIESFGDLKKK